MKILSHVSAEKKEKLKGFKFRTNIGRFQVTLWQWRGCGSTQAYAEVAESSSCFVGVQVGTLQTQNEKLSKQNASLQARLSNLQVQWWLPFTIRGFCRFISFWLEINCVC